MSGGSASPGSPDPRRGARRLWLRLPLLAGGAAALILGVATGLQRLGWALPGEGAALPELHGPLMVCGFFGTVIAIERAVALGRLWAYLGPLAAVLATVSALAGLPTAYAQAGWLVAGLVLLGASGVITSRHPAPFAILLSLGAAAWPISMLKWMAAMSMQGVVLWWMSFLVLTIAAERLELSRVLRPSALSRSLFWAPVALLLLAAIASVFDSAAAWGVAGLAFLGLGAWLARHDIARRTIRLAGLPRYAAACLLSGYAWLAIAGVVLLSAPVDADRLAYDAALHAVFLGFVFTMVFGHALIILPAVTGVSILFRPLLYVPLLLLNASVAARVGGDLLAAFELRSWSGVLSAAAIALFIVSILASIRRGSAQRSAREVCAATKTGSAGSATLSP